MFARGDDVYLGGTHYGLGDSTWGTALRRYAREIDDFEQLAILLEPGTFDLSYPGLVEYDESVYMVYYSTHLRAAQFQSGRMVAEKADIFPARLRL